MWIATVDFMKALDSINHNSIWDALVMTDKESDMFKIKKRTMQGDPLSGLLFNTALQVALKGDRPRWQKKKGMGICLGDCDLDCLTNLRYADDVLLFATSKEQLQKMLCDFKHCTEKVGLEFCEKKSERGSWKNGKGERRKLLG